MRNRKDKIDILSKEEKDSLILSIKKEIKEDVLRSVKKWFKLFMLAVGIIGVLGYKITFREIYNKVTENSTRFITETIAKKFFEPHIEATFKQITGAEAQNMMQHTIFPEIESFKKTIERNLGEVNSLAKDTKTKITEEVKFVGSEIGYLKQRNNLTRLADKAMVQGDRVSFDELNEVAKDKGVETQELCEAALAEILRVKNYYATMTRLKGLKDENLSYRGFLGAKRTYEDVSKDVLVRDLEGNLNWFVRARAADKLRGYNEVDVANALLNSVCQDSNLDVVKTALDSFTSITGYESDDVFGRCSVIQEWWRDNKGKVEERLKH